MSKNNLSLRQTMIFLALILLAIVSFTFAYLIFVSQKQGLTQQAEDYLLTYVAEAEWAISYPIEKSQAQIMSIARSPYIISPYDENEVSAEERDDLRQYLIDQLTSRGLFLELFIIDLDGKVLVSTKIEEENTDKSNRAYYQKAQGEVYIQSVYHNLAWQRPVLTIALPLKGKSGDLLGVLAGYFDVNEWDAFLRDASWQAESGVTYLVSMITTILSLHQGDNPDTPS